MMVKFKGAEYESGTFTREDSIYYFELYNLNHNLIYREHIDGAWDKTTYDENNKIIKCESGGRTKSINKYIVIAYFNDDCTVLNPNPCRENEIKNIVENTIKELTKIKSFILKINEDYEEIKRKMKFKVIDITTAKEYIISKHVDKYNIYDNDHCMFISTIAAEMFLTSNRQKANIYTLKEANDYIAENKNCVMLKIKGEE